jgi:radical SAM protein with 4Fe4S-binding SPASM domain
MTEHYLLQALGNRVKGAALTTQGNIELTHACNLICRHCYLEHEDHGGELTLNEWSRVIDQVVGMDCYFVAFTGGEILCREDFFDVVRYAKQKGVFYHFQTNGTLIDERVADTMRELNPTKVEISIQGATPESHDRVTGVLGSFEKSMRALELLKRRGIRIQLKTTVMNLNWREVPAIRKLAEGLGAGFQPDPVVMPGVFGSDTPSLFRMSDDDFREFMRMEGWHQEPDDEVSVKIRELDRPERRMICSAATSRLAITPQGDVFPCVLWHADCGNVRDQELSEIWHGERMSRCRNMELDLLNECKNCDIISTCVRCAALAYMEVGDELSRAPESCRMSKILKGAKDEEGV